VDNDDFYIGSTDEIYDSLENMNLEFSNEVVCDFIIDVVEKNTQNDELKALLNRVFVGFIENTESESAQAFPPINEDYLITLTEKMFSSLMDIGDILAAKLLFDFEYISADERDFVDSLINLCKRKINDTNVQKEIDDLFRKNNKNDLVPTFDRLSNEIFEISLGFVIGHEIGHHYYSHKGASVNIETMAMDKGRRIMNYVDDLNDEHWKELAADRFAFAFVHEFLTGFYHGKIKLHQLLGLFVAIMYICTRMNPFSYTNRHPAPLIRLIGIRCLVIDSYRSILNDWGTISDYVDWLFTNIEIKDCNNNDKWWHYTVNTIC